MSAKLITAYSFNASTKEVTFFNIIPIELERVLSVVNKTRGVTYYDPEDPTLLATAATNVLTLQCSTTGHANGDTLEIYYEGTFEDDSITQETAIHGHVQSIDGKTPSLVSGQVPVNDADAIAHLFDILNYLINVDSKLAALGPAFKIGSMPVTLSPDDPAVVALGEVQASPTANTVLDRLKTIGAKDFATSAKQDTGNSALVAVNTSIGTTNTEIGGLTETAPATDTASSGLNGRLQRIAQRLTSLIGLFPTSIGPKAKAGALAVTTATDDPLLALIGEVQASPTANTVLDRLKALLTGTSLAAGSAVIGKVGIDQTTPGTTNGVVVNDAPTLTKGTQGTKGFAVQNLHDSGRTSIVLYATGAAVGSASTETAITLTKSSGTAATTSADSFVVTSGKTFRIQGVKFKTRANNTATTHTTIVRLRLNTAGAVGTSSTPVLFAGRCISGAVSQDTDVFDMLFPEGYEIVGDGTLQIGVTVYSSYVTNAPTIDVSIWGYEY